MLLMKEDPWDHTGGSGETQDGAEGGTWPMGISGVRMAFVLILSWAQVAGLFNGAVPEGQGRESIPLLLNHTMILFSQL